MKLKTWAAVAAATAGLGAAPAVAQEPAPTPGAQQGGQQSTEAQQAAVQTFLRASARSNLFEIQSSEIALREARSAEVRRLARILIRHHTAMQAMLAEVARAQNVEVPTTLTARQRGDVRRLQRVSARNFDRAFLRIQVPAHQLSLRLHLLAARTELPAAVRLLAIEALPVIGDHLGRASTLLEQHASGSRHAGHAGS
jgi:putative membrane protein